MAVKSKSSRGQGERGSALLIVFVLAAFVLIMLYREMPVMAFEAQRQKEQLLVDRGAEYKRAIKLFYIKFNAQYPASIDQLENTNRMRFLRHRFKDPFTGKDDWRLLHMGPGGMLIDSKVNPLPLGNQGQSSFGATNSGFGGGASSFGSNNASSFGSNNGGSSFGSNASSFGSNNGGSSSFGSNSGSSFGSSNASSFGNSNSSFGGGASSFGSSSFGSSNSSFGTNSTAGANGGSVAATPQQPVSLGMPTAYITPGMPVVVHDYQSNVNGQIPIPQRPPAIPANTGQANVNPADPNAAQNGSNPGQNPLLTAFGGVAAGNQQTVSNASGQPTLNPFGVNGNPFGVGANAPVQLNVQDPAAAQLAGGNAGSNPNAAMLQQVRAQLTGGGNTPFPPQQTPNANGSTITGGAFAGVASKATGHTIKLIEDQQELSKWEFYYDPRKDVTPTFGTGGGALPAGGLQQVNSPNFWNGTTPPQSSPPANVQGAGNQIMMTPGAPQGGNSPIPLSPP